VPLASQLLLVGSWDNLLQTTSAAHQEIIFSAWIGLTSAVICLPLALPVSGALFAPGRTSWLWWLVVLLPLAVPAPLVGIGLVTIWNRPFFFEIYGSSLMPVLASLARFPPLAAIVLLAQQKRLNPSLLDAARIFQRNDLHTWSRVYIPLLTPGLLAASGLVLVLSVGELGATLIVAPPGQATLTMRIYNFLHYGASDTVAGLCLVITCLVLLLSILAIALLAGWSRLITKQDLS
jgi:iron(III) transport system permease protein